ncbi:NADH dehydrogenase [ubiquinone] iron-sulfur protein 2, mitochondrial, partial [Elysia marginata]
ERFLVSDEEPVNLITPSSSITEANTCTVTSYTTGSEDMLVKTDQISAAAITCPDPLLANFSPYTVTKNSGTACGTSGSINVCSHTTNVVVDYTSCSEVIYYSSGGSLNCVYYTNSGTTYYVHLMNLDNSVDNSATYYYTCLVRTLSLVGHNCVHPNKSAF